MLKWPFAFSPWLLVAAAGVLASSYALGQWHGRGAKQDEWDVAKAQAILDAEKERGEKAAAIAPIIENHAHERDALATLPPLLPVPADRVCDDRVPAPGTAALPRAPADPTRSREAAALAEAVAHDAARYGRCAADYAATIAVIRAMDCGGAAELRAPRR